MNWNNLFSEKRTGIENSTLISDTRSEYQKDFDRLIFYSGFRRLQNKTQVFPLPGVAFVHNRLTHSLEVASIGRSLGKIIGSYISSEFELDLQNKNFYNNELSNVIAASCLAHDIGNPPFGHSGEKAISNYFLENEDLKIENTRLRNHFDERFWLDLINFEGNANGLRLLTHNFNGKTPGGLGLTLSTLAATLKYPTEAKGIDENFKHRSKFNTFQSEKDVFKEICNGTGMIKENEEPIIFKRHPFVFLTEAADDICYRIIDFEDAHRLGILDAQTVIRRLKDLIICLRSLFNNYTNIETTVDKIEDDNDKIAFLRTKAIDGLTKICANRFIDNIEKINNGTFNEDLITHYEKKCSALIEIKKLTEKYIYNYNKVVKLEITGYRIIYDLLALFVPSILKNNPNHRDKKILKLIPKQFRVDNAYGPSDYEKVLSVLDFISGMTDTFATQLFQELYGIEITSHV